MNNYHDLLLALTRANLTKSDVKFSLESGRKMYATGPEFVVLYGKGYAIEIVCALDGRIGVSRFDRNSQPTGFDGPDNVFINVPDAMAHIISLMSSDITRVA